MPAFCHTIRVARAESRSELAERGEFVPAVFAGVLAFFVALIEGMTALGDSVWMTSAESGQKALRSVGFLSAVFAVEIGHNSWRSGYG